VQTSKDNCEYYVLTRHRQVVHIYVHVQRKKEFQSIQNM